MIIYPAKYWVDDKVKIKNSGEETIIREITLSNFKASYKVKGKRKIYKEEELELIEHDAGYFENAKFTTE